MSEEQRVWPPEKAVLEELVLQQELSYARIGKLFGVNRNVVSGACRRLGIVSGRQPACFTRKPGATRRKKPLSPKGPEGYKTRGCRWIDGDPKSPDHRWCGEPLYSLKYSYCKAHMKIAYLKHG